MFENNNIKYKILWVVLLIILVIISGGYYYYLSQIHKVINNNNNNNNNNNLNFQICKDYIFTENKSTGIKIQESINENDYKVLELKCIDLYPNKRDSTITIQEFSHNFTIAENNTVIEKIDFPDNVLLNKSTVSIEFKVPKPNVTLGTTFFGYSLWKVQNRDWTTRIWATHQNIINKSFTLEEVYYDDDTQFIVSNLMWNDIEVNYTIIYYIENY
jgi:hypothetical protein